MLLMAVVYALKNRFNFQTPLWFKVSDKLGSSTPFLLAEVYRDKGKVHCHEPYRLNKPTNVICICPEL